MDVHLAAARGYEAEADAYERGRAGYAPAALDELGTLTGLGPGSLAADVGAGTGKWSAELLSTGATVVAIEPVSAMRELLRRRRPGAFAAAGTAEHLPIRSGSVDVVTAAAAVHWFDLDRAVPEMTRVVRPGGHVALVRNERDRSVGWVAELDAILEPHRVAVPVSSRIPWRQAFESSPPLELVAEIAHRATQVLDAELLADRVASLSHVASLPPADRSEVRAAVDALARRLPATFDMPYTTVVVVLRKQP